MRKILLALTAIGAVAMAAPASAQYYGGPSFSFGFGAGPHYGGHHRFHGNPYYGYDGPYYGYGPRYGGYRRHRGCIVTVRRERWDGSVVIRRINRC